MPYMCLCQLAKAAGSENSAANAICPPSGTSRIFAGSRFLLRRFVKEFSVDACKSASPLSPQTPIWKQRRQSDSFDLFSFPSNQVVRITVGDFVAQSMWSQFRDRDQNRMA